MPTYWHSLFLLMCMIILILVIVSSLVIPELISCIKLLVANHGQVVNRFVKVIEHNKDLNTLWNSFDLEKIKWNQVGKYLTAGFGGTFKAIISTASSVFSTVATAVVAFFFSIYLLFYYASLYR